MWRVVSAARSALPCLLVLACDTAPGQPQDVELQASEIAGFLTTDGWTIRFDSLLVSVSEVFEGDGHHTHVEVGPGGVFDLAGPGPHRLARVPAGAGLLTWRLGPTTAPEGTADPDQRAQLAAQGWTLRATGTAERAGQRKTFDIGLRPDIGFACPLSRTGRVRVRPAWLFHDDLQAPEARLAFDLVAAADRDGDDHITTQELAQVDLSLEARYLTGHHAVSTLDAFIGILSTSWAFSESGAACGQVLVPMAWQHAPNPLAQDPAASRRGAPRYMALCASCHGPTGAGDGPLAATLEPPPQPFGRGMGAGYVAWRVAAGGGFPPFLTGMPAFADALEGDALWEVVAFVRTLDGR